MSSPLPEPITGSAPVTTPRSRVPSLRAAWLPFTALCLAFFVEMVDNTVLTIALPTMGRDLHASTAQLQWVTGAYSLVFGSLLLTAGSLADRFGRRRVLITGLAGFGLVSALVWLVTDANQLIALRAVMGLFAACMAPVTMSLVFRLFDDEKVRMRAISLMVMVGMGSMALGPVVAGGALHAVSWHWLLFVNTPIAAFAVLGLLLGVSKDTAEDLHRAPLDVPAAVLTMAAVGLGCYALTSGVDHGWGSPITVGCFVAAVLSVIGFILRERSARHPLLDLSLLTHPTVRGSALAQLASSVAMMAAMFLLILHFQYALGWSPMRAGLGNLPFVVMMLLSSPVSEKLITAFGHRVTCLVATASVVLGTLVLAVGVAHGYWVLAVGMSVMALGLRIIMTVCAVALIESVPEDRTSIGTALNDVAQELGTSLGTAVVGTMIAALVATVLPTGAWGPEFTQTFFHGERTTFLVVAALVAVVGGYGCATLTDSRSAEEH
ncbi:MFS transporter [Kocuria tytonis]|uniref:MFS transporter n=1 Tax=Kocuria tytonis TaxID=2054280 RepID=A0A495ADB1_9MICC|nr:MFS transporter [Kocuria tytonis]RKQ36805.1 MFS transporter [Kocuria tytonis]